jgi:1,4-alpha-glucan branching enzyme
MTKKKSNRHVFQVIAPKARSVVLVGDRTQIPMQKDAKGIWTTKVPLSLSPHIYRLRVDGQWQDNPVRTSRNLNLFGSEDTMREAA